MHKAEATHAPAPPLHRPPLRQARYGCARWTDEALQVLRAHSPLIEIGAGGGEWARALRERFGGEADVAAFDNRRTASPTSAPHGAPPAEGGGVRRGDERELTKTVHRGRTLFLCYPPPAEDYPLALRALALYRGRRLIYVGEGRGGVNAGPAFFSELEAEWRVVRTLPLRPFHQNHERLFVLERRRGDAAGGGGRQEAAG